MNFKTLLLLSFTSLNLNFYAYSQKNTPATANKGVEFFNNGDYKDAIDFFSESIRSDSTKAEHHFWIAKCYEQTAFKDKELYHYLKSQRLNPRISPDILYRIGKAYHENLFLNDAIKYYKLYKKDINDAGALQMNSKVMNEHIRSSKRIHECENAKVVVSHPYDHKIFHLTGIINSEYDEYTPSVSSDNNKMIFTSRRPGGSSDKKDKDNGYFEDVWMSLKDTTGEWMKPVNLKQPVNTESHDACVAMDATGTELFLYRTTNGGDIYYSQFENGQWSKPESLKQVNSKYKEPSVCISSNGKVIYFSSNKPGGYGGLDIYRTERNKDGLWSEALNLGSLVNSEYDEDSPFISPDGKTVYFSSNGHNNMGGYDIFSINYDVRKKAWSTPLNLGFPINSADDDIYFSIAGDHKTAYYASAKKDGFGEKDIYMIVIDTSYISKPLLTVAMGGAAPAHIASIHPSTLKMHEGPHQIKPHLTKQHPKSVSVVPSVPIVDKAEIVEFKGKVLDENEKPVESNITVKKEKTAEMPREYMSKEDGTFSIPLERGFQYGIDIQKDGYVFASSKIDLSTKMKTIPKFEEKVVLKKPKVGTKIIMKNIFYGTGNASLEPSSFSEIDILNDFLSKNPTIQIEISGHTDNRGTSEVNKELSTSRARVIYKLLVKKGIEPERIKYVGYGSERPIAPNDTEAGRGQNRRTEFEIVYQ